MIYERIKLVEENTKKKSILQIINQGAYIEAETIAQKVGIKLAEVSSYIEKLSQYGLLIDKRSDNTYQLEHPLFLLDEQTLQKSLYDKEVLVTYFISIDSTNNYLLHSATPEKSIQLCITEHQTNGRGRFNRSWISPFAENIYLSLQLAIHKDINELSGISLAVAVTIVQNITNLYKHLDLKIKWPNDLYLNNKKLGGILVEIKSSKNSETKIIIGIGLNVNMVDSQIAISQPWISLRQVLGQTIDRSSLVINLVKDLLKELFLFEKKGFSAFNNTYQQYDYLYGKKLVLSLGVNNQLEGYSAGVDEVGQLQLQTTQGLLRFSSGDTAIIKDF